MPGLGLGKHQSFAAQNHEKTVTPRHVLTTIQGDEHQPQLVATDTGIFLADFLDGFDNLTFMFHLSLNVCLRLVEGLTAMAK